ncbi:flagellar basal body-associated protein FliL [Vibrio alginolyticus]|jgi:flagellar FliL protein|uniref:Flagellar protein FliL n=2 Tax=Vibrio alginolyticus TaxID=663 RepID=A0A7H8DP68_VIBAL|nr:MULTISPECIES: flagellar basal body-associated protein FliL [Vibrio]MDW1807991.1 flagellar basal body-associated protein FliL [Vibrio sp. Vb2362]MDW1970435.1 flagellar basal body-associated protein FliL [Vibrio sp. 945]NAW54872.1 flagellar basal body-associated protein FliL [Vibrio sp. V41_P2S12T139]NAW94097.1 flagellar basal body-associated protein FliL [Vibrio sp. V42_P2S4T144]QCO86786.1 flagellar basal body-associated protein FliL [Vibrio neocaledonicus]QIR89244.1 flagellar basal body-as
MAEEQLQGADAPKGKSKLLIIIIAVVVLLLGGGAAAFFLMGSDEPAQAESSQQAQVKASDAAPIAYVNLPQAFVFNVTGDSRDRLVQIKAQLMVRGAENEELARYHSPLIESSMLSTFASATVDQLRSPTGRVELRDRASEDIKAALNAAVGKPVIEKVLFTDFVIQ